MCKREKTLLAGALLLIAGTNACNCVYTTKHKFGPKETTSLVIVFKPNVSKDAINEFDKTVISMPHESGNGIRSLPGIRSGFLFSRNGYDGIGLNLREDSTDEQRQFIRNRVLESDVVSCIRENIQPYDLGAKPCS